MKRLTIDLPVEIHMKFKLYCTAHGLKMSQVMQGLVLKAVAPPKKRGKK